MEGTKTKQNKKTKSNQPTKKISHYSFTSLFQKEYGTFLSYKFAQIEHILFNILNKIYFVHILNTSKYYLKRRHHILFFFLRTTFLELLIFSYSATSLLACICYNTDKKITFFSYRYFLLVPTDFAEHIRVKRKKEIFYGSCS